MKTDSSRAPEGPIEAEITHAAAGEGDTGEGEIAGDARAAEPGDAESADGEPAPGEAATTLLELVLAAHAERTAPRAEPARIDGVVIGRITALGPAGEPMVDYAESLSEEAIPARAMTAVGPADVGREAALLFEGGDRSKPVVMGLMHVATEPASAAVSASPTPSPEGEIDGERLVFTADKEIVLRCGKASITLTRAGKILIRGAYVLARSSGVNRIQGGSVQIN